MWVSLQRLVVTRIVSSLVHPLHPRSFWVRAWIFQSPWTFIESLTVIIYHQTPNRQTSTLLNFIENLPLYWKPYTENQIGQFIPPITIYQLNFSSNSSLCCLVMTERNLNFRWIHKRYQFSDSSIQAFSCWNLAFKLNGLSGNRTSEGLNDSVAF